MDVAKYTNFSNGGDQGAGVLSEVKRQSIEATGDSWGNEEESIFRDKLLNQYKVQSSAYYSTSRLWDDGIIDPVETREVLSRGLTVALNTPVQTTKFGIFRM